MTGAKLKAHCKELITLFYIEEHSDAEMVGLSEQFGLTIEEIRRFPTVNVMPVDMQTTIKSASTKRRRCFAQLRKLFHDD